MVMSNSQITSSVTAHKSSKNYTRDAVDYVNAVDEVDLAMDAMSSDAISNGIEEFYEQQQREALMHENLEFSDMDDPMIENARPRTRSQSRAKETSVPPVETKIKVTRRKPVKGRRNARRVLEEDLTTDENQ
jgi:cobalamin-dependent methionine synthase I